MRGITDLAQLPRTSDSWTFLYVERVRVERADGAIELRDKVGRVPVPVASLSALLLGPGSTVTHAAVGAISECGCSAIWCGEGITRFYAAGHGETRRAHHIEAQAKAWADESRHLEVVKKLYSMRFREGLPEGLTLQQIRGREGARVRDAYAAMSKETGVKWRGRDYKRDNWSASDPVNRALSAANACLYGVCHAAIVATGFSPALGFLHVGKQLSFVYDVADLYKVELTIPMAFQVVAEGSARVESRVRELCRERFYSGRLLERIVPDLQSLVGLSRGKARLVAHRGEESQEEQPAALWEAGGERTAGGRNFAPGPGLVKISAGGCERSAEPKSDADDSGLCWPPTGSNEDDGVPF